MGKNICLHCCTPFKPKRNPEQRYCSHGACQNKRKQIWRKTKLTGDEDYWFNQQAANKRWQKKRPSYWSHYRTQHPGYAKRNREQQHQRDKQRRDRLGSPASPLAKSDALPLKNVLETGTYRLIRLEEGLAKSDALTVKLSLITTRYPQDADLAKSPPYSTSPDNRISYA